MKVVYLFFYSSFLLSLNPSAYSGKTLSPSFLYRNKNLPKYIFVVMLFLGALYRFYGLDALHPVRDELLHLNAAKHFLDSGIFHYPRGLSITYSISFLWYFFNNGETSLFLARLIPFSWGVLSIILVYFFVKENTNRHIAFLAMFLLAISPFHIGISQYVRDYSIIFVFEILLLIFLLRFLKNIHCSGRIFSRKNYFYMFLLFLFSLYYFINDFNSLFLLNFLSLFFFSLIYILSIFILYRDKLILLYKDSSLLQKIFFYSFLVILFLVATYAIYRFTVYNVHFAIHEINLDWFHEFFLTEKFNSSYAAQWYFDTPYSSLFLVLFFLFGGLLKKYRKFWFSNMFTFFSLLAIFTFLLDRYFAPRYMYILLLFLTIGFSISIYTFFSFIHYFRRKLVFLFVSLSFFLTLFPPLQSYSLIKEQKNGEISMLQGLLHNDFPSLVHFLYKNGFSPGDTLITPHQYSFLYYFDEYKYVDVSNRGDFPLKRMHKKWGKYLYDAGDIYSYSPNYNPLFCLQERVKESDRDLNCDLSESSRIEEIIKTHSKGFFIFDSIRVRSILPKENFVFSGIPVTYLGHTKGEQSFYFYVYSWGY